MLMRYIVPINYNRIFLWIELYLQAAELPIERYEFQVSCCGVV